MEHHPHHNEHHIPRPDDGVIAFIRDGIVERNQAIDYDNADMLDDLHIVLQLACTQAHLESRPITARDARAIAAVLATALPPDTPLRSFAEGRATEPADLWSDIDRLRDLNLRPRASEYLTWLSGHLVATQLPDLAPTPPNTPAQAGAHLICSDKALGLIIALHSASTAEDDTSAHEALCDAGIQLALNHGMPAVAYLRIPTVDAARPDLAEAFDAAYWDSFDTINDIFNLFFRIFDIDQAGTQTRRYYEELSPEEQHSLQCELGAKFQLIESGGQFHLFRRTQ